MWVPKAPPAHSFLQPSSCGLWAGCQGAGTLGDSAPCSALTRDKGVWGQRLVTPTPPMGKKKWTLAGRIKLTVSICSLCLLVMYSSWGSHGLQSGLVLEEDRKMSTVATLHFPPPLALFIHTPTTHPNLASTSTTPALLPGISTTPVVVPSLQELPGFLPRLCTHSTGITGVCT